MKNKSQWLCIVLCVATTSMYAQVGINTSDPQNDLHINGGLRIDDRPTGSNDDAQNRILATTAEGDIVSVTVESVLSALRVPVLAFNAHFGVTPPPGDIPFFAGCNPCANDELMPLNFSDEEIIIDSPLIDLLNADNAVDSDEIFRFNEAGDYRVELNLTPIYGGDSRYRVNIVLSIFNASGVFKGEEAIRLFAGEPTTSSTTYGVPGYITDTRNYEAGDLLVMDIEVATVTGTERSVESGRVIGASYGSQVTITKY